MCERVDLGGGNFAIVCGMRRSRGRCVVKLPATEEEIRGGGWSKQFERACRLCHTPLIFYRTLDGKLMPTEMILVDGQTKIASHFATCPHALNFRKPKQERPKTPSTGDLFA